MTEDFQAEGAAEAALLSLYPFAHEKLKLYVDILAKRGIDWGLLGPREGARLWSRHVGNSLALADLFSQGLWVADVGSGAGLPGIPIALGRPDLRMVLIEPLQRRFEFLRITLAELGLQERVSVVRCRAEDYQAADEWKFGELPERFDVVTCRAVAPLGKLVGWTKNLFYPDGKLVALKGQSAEEEMAKAAGVLRKLKLRAEVVELSPGPGLPGTRAIQVIREG